MKLNKAAQFLLVTILLLAMAIILVFSAKEDSLTVDEGVYISSGYTHYKIHNHKLNIEHPPLAKLIVGLPLLFLNPMITNQAKLLISENNQYGFANEFIFNSGNNADLIIFTARIPSIVLTIILGILVFWFVKKISKSSLAGLISLFLYCLSPIMIANGHLATLDIYLTFFFFLSIVAIYNYFQKPSFTNTLLIAGALAGTILCKFSGLILLPAILVIFIYNSFINKKFIKNYFFDFLIILFGAAVIIYFMYFFLYGSINLFFGGVASQFIHSTNGVRAFLFGYYSQNGWWYYFPLAWLIKTPISEIILFFTAIFYFLKNKLYKNKNYLIIFFTPIIYSASLLFSKINIGLRYALPVELFIIIAVGVLIKWQDIQSTLIKSTLVCLGVWYLINFIQISPYQLTFFNECVSGAKNGANYLVDSNIDWGQDLKRLKNYLVKNNINEKIYLSYFGNADPNYYQINYQQLPNNVHLNTIKGYVAVSVQNLKLPLDNCENYPECANTFIWFNSRQPVAEIGNSIYIYNIK